LSGSTKKRNSQKYEQKHQKKPEYEVLVDLGNNLQIVRVDLDDLREQNLNARAMSREMLNQLTYNIQQRGALESIPYCALTDQGIEIISGHHRIRSARQAALKRPELKTVVVLLDVSGLSRSEIAAKQLAHNSIQGIDDPQTIARIYELIDNADLRTQAFIDPKILDFKLQPIPLTQLDSGLKFQVCRLVFLPFQLENFERVIEMLDGTEDQLLVAPLEQWDKFKEAVQKVMAKENIRSLGTALAKMSETIIELYKPQRTPYSLTEEPCLSCKPETKKHCLTPGDPGPNC